MKYSLCIYFLGKTQMNETYLLHLALISAKLGKGKTMGGSKGVNFLEYKEI